MQLRFVFVFRSLLERKGVKDFALFLNGSVPEPFRIHSFCESLESLGPSQLELNQLRNIMAVHTAVAATILFCLLCHSHLLSYSSVVAQTVQQLAGNNYANHDGKD